MKRMLKAGCLAFLALVSMALWAQDDKGDNVSDQGAEKSAATEQHTPTPAVPADYVIGADDTLHITVWKEPDMSVSLPVRPDGKISVPLLDDVQAAGLTPMQLSNVLTEKLKKYVTDPRVTVMVTTINSRRIYVLGEVEHSGTVPLLSNMTVLQVLASAGF